MRLGICQTQIMWEDKEKNKESARLWVEKAAGKGAELVLFPEMSFTGFSMNIRTTGETDGQTVQDMRGLAAKQQIAVGFGWTKLRGGRGENHYTVVDDMGRVTADYIKLHPFSYLGEDKCFWAGEKLASFSYRGVCIGIQICYDLRFPEAFQMLSKECSLIVVPANWPAARRAHWKCLLQARAIETQVYVVGINCFGAQEETAYTGDSAVFDPLGSRIAGFAGQEQMMLVDIPENITKYRSSFPMKKDRRWELYQKWYREDMGL